MTDVQECEICQADISLFRAPVLCSVLITLKKAMKCNEKHGERSTHYVVLLVVKLGTLVC